jgi:DNA-binding beta-propeller fold protein YncE
VVLIANDETFDNFITFINADTYQVIQKIKFDGTDPNADHILANGIEQCIFNPKDGNF